ncbi:type II toxin-antitoxin system RelE/ParE family toxin [Runella sp.]|jgi:plasmid stabilization system protein ParE|uniref:type II toxin-antitoxin system RelE/ParE family toxin n=1 Tax=Runella sp. TaxID=1960881 RepID=UPI002609F63C|nr:type II toxin-antitoxin system RelE/ParE family toxin [Runella sp.]
MEVNPYAVEVTERFRKHFKEIYDFIQQQSYQSSQKLQKDIVDLVAEICERPHSYNIAKIAQSKKVFRYVKIMKSYKVYFYVEKEIVVILDILHEKRSLTSTDYMEEI